MDHRYFAIVQALTRHALYAAASLPEDHPQRRILRHQVDRLIQEFSKRDDMDKYDKLCRLAKWFDDGAVVSGDIAVLSES
jgi:hypothetical protein